MTRQSLFTRSKDFWHRQQRWQRRLPVLLIAVVVIYGGLWWAAAWQIQILATDWIDERRQRGDVITYETLTVKGFPLAWNVHLLQPSWQPNNVLWPEVLGSPEVHLSTSLSDFGMVTLSRPATVTLSPKQPANAARLRADVTDFRLNLRQPGSQPSGKLRARALEFEWPAGSITAKQLDFTWQVATSGGQNSQELQLDLSDVTLPDSPVLSSGGGQVSLAVDVIGDVGDGRRDSMAAWRDNGGVVELRRLAVDFSPVTLNGDATVTLDQDLQLAAAGRFDVGGVDTVIKSAVQSGHLTPRAAAVAQFIITGLRMKNKNRSKQTIELPLSIQAGKIWLGPVAIAAVPRLRWDPPK